MPEKRRTYDEDEELDYDRSSRKRRKKSNTGLILGLSLGGGALLILIVVLAVGAGLGWFDSAPPDNPFMPGPNVQGQGQPKQDPEATALDTKWTIEKRGGMTIEEINKLMGGPFREVPFQEVQRYFQGIAFQNKIEGMFMDNVAKMKARKWYTWTKAGRMFVAGLSQYKDGHWGLTMYGHYTEQNKAFFNVWPMIVDERELAWRDGNMLCNRLYV